MHSRQLSSCVSTLYATLLTGSITINFRLLKLKFEISIKNMKTPKPGESVTPRCTRGRQFNFRLNGPPLLFLTGKNIYSWNPCTCKNHKENKNSICKWRRWIFRYKQYSACINYRQRHTPSQKTGIFSEWIWRELFQLEEIFTTMVAREWKLILALLKQPSCPGKKREIFYYKEKEKEKNLGEVVLRNILNW